MLFHKGNIIELRMIKSGFVAYPGQVYQMLLCITSYLVMTSDDRLYYKSNAILQTKSRQSNACPVGTGLHFPPITTITSI